MQRLLFNGLLHDDAFVFLEYHCVHYNFAIMLYHIRCANVSMGFAVLQNFRTTCGFMLHNGNNNSSVCFATMSLICLMFCSIFKYFTAIFMFLATPPCGFGIGCPLVKIFSVFVNVYARTILVELRK